ncbi:MAG: thiamine pyrophosphate-binding protein [Lachnospiraceae bacterium]|jgi:acetolactate synthase-1/2/3 large subunit|nr:thiamine pyrophosphate-binding protein [Lachnospiraceae bacterium]
MKVSDYIIHFLEQQGIKDVFLLSGGGMMHLLDSVSRSTKINKYYNLNEQATSICADAYAQYTNEMSVCMVTTGPGGTNAITGVVSAYQDSTPILIISGQVKTTDLAPERVRVYGPQEVNITGIVKEVTKYAVTVKKVEEIRYHLEKAIYLATNGRRGPVWVDIPLDIQAADIDTYSLKGYHPEEENSKDISSRVKKIVEGLNQSKKPTILFGHGVIAAKAQSIASELANILKIPVLSTWRAKELFHEQYEYFYGFPGSQAPRYSNFTLQNADYLLIVGSRLDTSLTAFNEANFAKNAKKVIIDIDDAEMNKLHMEFEDMIQCDAKYFLSRLLENVKSDYKWEDKVKWLEYCRTNKEKYPIYKERPLCETNYVYGYDFAKALTENSTNQDVFVASPTGRVCIAMNLGIALKTGQKFVGPRGLGSMGYALPSAIGACIASGYRRTIVFEGDGSLQHNIQELQLIKTYNLPIKLFVYNNGGYSSIYGMQSSHFKKNLAGCTAESGVLLPDIEDIAKAYHINYYKINNADELDQGIQEIMKDDRAIICEVIGDITFEEIPRTQTRVNKDGSLSSSTLEDLYPFI